MGEIAVLPIRLTYEMEPLDDAFSGFNETVERLRQEYAQLAQSVAGLNLTLESHSQAVGHDRDVSDGSRPYLDGILESMNTGILITDSYEEITHFNRKAEELTGYSAQEAIGMGWTEFFGEQLVEGDLCPILPEACTSDAREEKLLATKSGKLTPVEVNVSPIFIGTGDEVKGYVMVFRDLSEQKALEEDIDRARTLTVLGEMAAVLAHEIRNPLGGINGFATLLERDLDADDPRKIMARKIIDGVTTLDRIVSKLFVFTKPNDVMRRLDLWSVIQEGALAFIRQECDSERGNIRITTAFPKKKIEVEGDPEMLTEIFLNLFRNAVQAMQNGGELRIQVDVLPRDADGQKRVQIRISDTGMGISPEDMERIFVPFYTTKTVGTGLGLAIADRIVRAHGGNIKVESELGKGSSFVITLPAC